MMKLIGERLANARTDSGYSQEDVAAILDCSYQAVSNWERGKNPPGIFTLNKLAKLYHVSVDYLLNGDNTPMHNIEFEKEKRDRIFDETRMYTYIKSYAQNNHLHQTLFALQEAREQHDKQFRKGQDKVPFIYHPLLCACHCLALGLNSDMLVAATLLHDVCEDCNVNLEDLPIDEKTKNIVKLLTKPPQSKLSDNAKENYYDAIFSDPHAALIKLLDRCNNISSMATGFTDEEISAYINETEKFIFPRIRKAKTLFPKYSNHFFLLKYHMVSVMESLKHEISSKQI